MWYIRDVKAFEIINPESSGLYYGGRQSQQSFLLSPSTRSLHVSGRAGRLQVNISFPPKLIIAYCFEGK
jgi:hypothetical protein